MNHLSPKCLFGLRPHFLTVRENLAWSYKFENCCCWGSYTFVLYFILSMKYSSYPQHPQYFIFSIKYFIEFLNFLRFESLEKYRKISESLEKFQLTVMHLKPFKSRLRFTRFARKMHFSPFLNSEFRN